MQCNGCDLTDLKVTAFDHLGAYVEAPISLVHESEEVVEMVFSKRLSKGVYTLVLDTGTMTYIEELIVKL